MQYTEVDTNGHMDLLYAPNNQNIKENRQATKFWK